MTFASFALIYTHKGCFPYTQKQPQGHPVAIQSNMQNGERVLCEINGPMDRHFYSCWQENLRVFVRLQ